jgi:UDP-N-acetylmuramate dehydrogenase
LDGEVFHGIRMADETTCVVGAAVTLAEMLDWMAERQLTGFEFVQGIPGTLGGGMHMNAGAWRQSLGDHVLWVRGLDPQGREQVVDRERLQLGYRHCGYLKNHYVIEAAFRVATGDPEQIDAEREAIRKKRAWMSGYRSAGSAFKNPVDEHAGRLLEKAGMRGKRIGGAAVFEGHGNFITASEGASASDVRALIGLGRMAVSDAFDVHLETEVRVIHSGRVLA